MGLIRLVFSQFAVGFFVFHYCGGTINVCVPVPGENLDQNAELNRTLDGFFREITDILGGFFAPLDFAHVDVNLSHPALHLKGQLDNVTINDLSDLHVCYLMDVNNVSETHASVDLFNMTFNRIKLNGSYDLNGDIGDLFAIFGKGDFWAQMHEFSVAMTRFQVTSNETELCAPINLDINLQKINNHFYHLMNDTELEDLFNRAFEDILPRSMKIVWQEWKDMFDAPLEKIIHDIIHKHPVVARIFMTPSTFADYNLGPFCYSTKKIKAE